MAVGALVVDPRRRRLRLLRAADADLARPARAGLGGRVALAPIARPSNSLLLGCVSSHRSTLARRAEPHDVVRRQLERIAAPAPEVHPEGPGEQRVASPERAAQRLGVVVPELSRPRTRRRCDAGAAGSQTRIGKSSQTTVSACLEDEIAELAPVGAVDHPAVGGDDRLAAVRAAPRRASRSSSARARARPSRRTARPAAAQAPGRASSCRCRSRSRRSRPSSQQPRLDRLLALGRHAVAARAVSLADDLTQLPPWKWNAASSSAAYPGGRMPSPTSRV